MARGERKSNEEKINLIDSEIEEVKLRISKLQNKVSDLENQKQEIIDSMEREKLSELKSALDLQGISVEKALELFKSDNKTA